MTTSKLVHKRFLYSTNVIVVERNDYFMTSDIKYNVFQIKMVPREMLKDAAIFFRIATSFNDSLNISL